MLLSFPREIGLRRNICTNRDSFDSYVNKLNGRASCYTSLYSFGARHPTRQWKMDIDSVIIDRAWWDFDIVEGGNLDDVREDVGKLLPRLTGDVRLVFTGRGFHVHEIFEKAVVGRAIARHVDRYEREMASDLITLDGVGHPQKLTRIPDTYNTTRKKWSVNIDPKSFIKDPLNFNIPNLPDPSMLALDPFRGASKHSALDIISWIAKNPIKEIPLELGEFNGDIGSVDQIPIPPCLSTAITHENPKHHVRIALAQHLAENLRWFASPNSLSREQKTDMVDKMVSFMSTLGWRDFNPSTSRTHINSMINYENTPSCSWLQARGMCTGPCWRDDGTRK